ncbi:hypothetical protein LRD18_13255, partial [Halorhodospira halochloris]|uniref:hypothetical protein n=1 Tax=Halorhodospira halochloris TaxID=1052 RepID=UPI001EE880A4
LQVPTHTGGLAFPAPAGMNRWSTISERCMFCVPLHVLRRIQHHQVHLAGQEHEGFTKPTQEQLELFEELGVDVPQRPG